MQRGNFFKKVMFANKTFIVFFFPFFFILALLFVNPIGNFPLNDDWSYGRVALELVRSGVYSPLNSGGMTLISHVTWGALVAKIFAPDFTGLRLSSLFALFISSLLLIKIINLNKTPDLLIFWLIFVFNPVIFLASNTFMTNISFQMFFLASVYSYQLLDKNESTLKKTTVFLSTTLAVMCRQVGLILPVTYFIIDKIKKKENIFKIPLSNFYFLLIFSNIIFIFIYYLSYKSKIVGPYGFGAGERNLINNLFDKNLIEDKVHNFIFLTQLISVPLFPVILTRIKKLEILISVALAIFAFHILPHQFSEIISGYYRNGFNPIVLKEFPFQFPTYVLSIINYLSLISFFSLFCFAISIFKELPLKSNLLKNSDNKFTFLLMFFLYSIPIYISYKVYEEYTIPSFVLLLILISKYKKKNKFNIISYLFAIAIVFFSLFGVKDYLSWNRVRWSILNNLEFIKQTPAYLIDGAFEWNNYKFYPNGRNFNAEPKFSIKFLNLSNSTSENLIIQKECYYSYLFFNDVCLVAYKVK